MLLFLLFLLCLLCLLCLLFCCMVVWLRGCVAAWQDNRDSKSKAAKGLSNVQLDKFIECWYNTRVRVRSQQKKNTRAARSRLHSRSRALVLFFTHSLAF